MIIYDFFAGTGSSTQAFVNAGHQVFTFELDKQFTATETVDITNLTAEYLLRTYGQPDFIWASPPCTTFSVASIGHHWSYDGVSHTPKTTAAINGQQLVAHTLKLIQELQPRYGWLMENPRGILRKLPVVAGIPRRTITYCQYGERRMKPTDLWGEVSGWIARPTCKNGDKCHDAAPRGSRTGTQGIKRVEDKSRIPYALGLELLQHIEQIREKGESS